MGLSKMKNRTFNKCLECDKIWITQKPDGAFAHLSRDYYDKSTEQKPFIEKCRKCVVKSRMDEINKKIEVLK